MEITNSVRLCDPVTDLPTAHRTPGAYHTPRDFIPGCAREHRTAPNGAAEMLETAKTQGGRHEKLDSNQ